VEKPKAAAKPGSSEGSYPSSPPQAAQLSSSGDVPVSKEGSSWHITQDIEIVLPRGPSAFADEYGCCHMLSA